MAQSPARSLSPGRRNAVVALLVIAAVAVLVAIPFLWRQYDQEYVYFDDYAQASAAGAVGDGRIPPLTPPGATEIHRQHRRSADVTFFRFTYAEGDTAAIATGLRRLPPEEVERLRMPTSGLIPWWPLSSRTMSGSQGEKLHVYEVPATRGGGHLALDPRTRTAYHWRS